MKNENENENENETIDISISMKPKSDDLKKCDSDMSDTVTKILESEGLSINFGKLENKLKVDQGRDVALSDGCYSNPGGPGC